MLTLVSLCFATLDTTLERYTFFQGCGEGKSWDTDYETHIHRCQQNLLESPFNKIVYSFVNGKDVSKNRTVNRAALGCLPDRDLTCVDPFQLTFAQNVSNPWKAYGLDAAFAQKMRLRGKELLVGLGGGDNGDTCQAVGRIFTQLYKMSKQDSSITDRFASTVSSFLRGDTKAQGVGSTGVSFDGIVWDNEEAHTHLDNISTPDPCTRKEDNAHCPDNWLCPVGNEVLSSRGGMDFIAELSSTLHNYVGRFAEFDVCLQPTSYVPYLYGLEDCGNLRPRSISKAGHPRCGMDPAFHKFKVAGNNFTGFPLPVGVASFQSYNNYMYLLENYPEAGAAVDKYVMMM